MNTEHIPTPKPPKAYVTSTLCIVMIVVWVLELIFPQLLPRFAFVPAIGIFEPWRFLTAAFLHSIPMPFHLAFNCWALWVVGRALEPVLGRLRLLAAFVICAIGAMLAQCLVSLINPQAWVTLTVGASGAVFGFFGIVLAIQRVLRLPWSEMAALIGINFILGFFLPNVAWVAHLGGLLVGLVIGAYTGWSLRQAQFVTVPITPENSGDSEQSDSSPSKPGCGQYLPSESDLPEPSEDLPNNPSSTDATIRPSSRASSETNGSAVLLQRVVTPKEIARDVAVYLGLFAILVGCNWLFYHFNYEAIYAILQLSA